MWRTLQSPTVAVADVEEGVVVEAVAALLEATGGTLECKSSYQPLLAWHLFKATMIYLSRQV